MIGRESSTAQEPNAATARVDAELARARAEVARIQARGAADIDARVAQAGRRGALQVGGDGQNTSVTTSPDGRTTTINENGKITTIETAPNGQVTIREGGNETKINGPGSEAIARLAQQQAHSSVPAFPRFPRDREEQIPDGVVPLAGIIFGMIASTIVLFPITRAYARRMDRKTAEPMAAPDTTVRLDRIEQAIETIAVEVERVSEAQRYSAKLLTERLPEPVRGIRAAETVR